MRAMVDSVNLELAPCHQLIILRSLFAPHTKEFP